MASSSPIPRHRGRLDLDSIRVLVLSIDKQVHQFILDPNAWKSLKLKCASRLRIQTQEFFEFSEQSVLSNLYWGIENVEIAIRADCPEEKSAHLTSSEQMLQVPALLNEDGKTGGVSNVYLICCAYFYLSLVRKLEGDEWQMTLHFLQALLVSPRLVRVEFMPEIWEGLFFPQIMSPDERGEDAIDEEIVQLARRYKDWMMYYRVVLYGETPRWIHGRGAASTNYKESSDSVYEKSASTTNFDWVEQNNEVLHDVDLRLKLQEDMKQEKTGTSYSILYTEEENEYADLEDVTSQHTKSNEVDHSNIKESSHIKCLQDMLKDSQSDMSISIYSLEGSDSEEKMQGCRISVKTPENIAGVLASRIGEGNMLAHCSIRPPECVILSSPEAFGCSMHEEAYELNSSSFFSSRSQSSVNELKLSILDLKDTDLCSFQNYCFKDEARKRRSPSYDFICFKHMSPTFDHEGYFERKELEKNLNEVCLNLDSNSHIEVLRKFEKAVSALCSSEGLKKCEDAGFKLSTVWEILKNETGTKYNLVNEVILAEWLNIISTSKEKRVVRALVDVLLVLISANGSLVEDIKRKDSHLYDLASALKQNVHEAAILIYLLSPSPTEVKELEILPALLEVACKSKSYKYGPQSFPLTPATASIRMIEGLVTKCDYESNNMNLATITSPQILSRLMDAAKYVNLEEGSALVTILISCMRFDGNCKNYLSQAIPVSTFLHLLESNKRHVKFAALDFFHEILRMPRSSATSLLHQIRRLGKINILHTLMACMQGSKPEYQLLAANLLLQLDMMENAHGRSIFREEAMEVLLESLASEGSPSTQALSAFILSNLGGTYAWSGEPYTVAWLLKLTGLTSSHHRNMIRNFDWSDPSLQDSTADACCSNIAKGVIKFGNSVFQALEKGLKSNIRTVSRDCLTTIAWLGCELALMDPNNLRYSATEILLGGIIHFLHPGKELDERLLACLSLYNYASGKGMKNLMNYSGLRESLRHLSSITWMAEELLKVTDYTLPTKSHMSCVHTHILEASHMGSGAVSALIYYKGQLCSGYADGSIKVWDIKGQTAKLVWEVKEHKKAVTCFAHFEPGDGLLSGSADKTVRVWHMCRKRLECMEVIEMKEVIQKIDTHGQLIFIITQSHRLKVCNGTRTTQTICTSKHVKCIAVAQGKIFIGCTDSSIQEVDIVTAEMREIKATERSWWMQKQPINSIVLYKDWIYYASDTVEGSNFKEWRKCNGTQVSIAMERRTNVLALEVVEDFMYLNCSSSPTILEIWLREKHQKVGRLSAGGRITSLLTANGIVLCGTETGSIKGWIPL
ncbi:hypothetical protein AAC387_Pa10g1805 [Persea americana]